MKEEPRDIATQRIRLMDGLRAFGGTYNEFGRRFAAWLGVHSTDAVALVEIFYAEERGAPLSPARLSERISLSSGATTALLNRLEQAGHIVRTREHADRRIITLHSSPGTQKLGAEFFTPLSARLDAMLADYPPELLQRYESFLADLNASLNEQLSEPDPPTPAPRP
ncbi:MULTISPECIES: MarR family winged helix-turn-helix transcriptional regulator [Actinomadura]|uniref:MarR family winged helix-turn-helix transcriptional regulator n=1 Tax=Actinomadura yumaensis TaxID=111807 RepID=A0ABW2CSR4_9ACTN|nr:MarR family transcriptional regulator [Actinomadura sp. J1-007]MWK36239.1 MarR family transcriptional regulator [Actinomadura sp. J1-007]